MAQDYIFGHVSDNAETDPTSARTSPPSFRTTLRPSGPASRAFGAHPQSGRWDLPHEGDVLAQRYRVEQVRAQHGHELVLFASHIDLGQRVLVRMLSPEASELPEVVTRFARAARKALENRSEHAERVIDYGRLESGCPYRVSELPQGPSLAEILEVRGALPLQEAANVMISACEAVAEMHASNLLYRGLCPASMFIERRADGTPLVRVVDFGSPGGSTHEALLGHELTIPGADLMSTALPYTAPEQLRHPAAVDTRADLWALGAICYELLVGRAPFRAENPVTLLSMIAADKPTPPMQLRHDVPEGIERLVLDCLSKDPEQRPSSALELVNTLLPFASPELDELAERVQRILRRSSHPGIPGAQSSSLRASHSLNPTSARHSGALSRAPHSYRAQAAMDLGVEGANSRRSSVSGSASRAPGAASLRATAAPESNSPWPIAVVAIALSIVGAVVTTVLLRDEVPGFGASSAPLSEPNPPAKVVPASSPSLVPTANVPLGNKLTEKATTAGTVPARPPLSSAPQSSAPQSSAPQSSAPRQNAPHAAQKLPPSSAQRAGEGVTASVAAATDPAKSAPDLFGGVE